MSTAAIRLYNTMTQRLEPLEPLEPRHVRIYLCGPTTYDHAHAGHARTYVAFDVLVRFLRVRGYRVTFVRNVTDVDDKILKRALERGEAPLEFSRRMSLVNDAELRAIGCVQPDFEPRVSENIPEIVSLIEQLVAKGVGVRRGDGGGRRRVLRRPRVPRLRQALPPQHRRSPVRRARRGRRSQARPARLRALEGERRRRVGAGTARGAKAGPGGTSSARRWREPPHPAFRHSRRRNGSHLSSPRERDRAERSGVGSTVRAPLDALRVSQRRRREDEQVARQLRDHRANTRAERRRGAPLLFAGRPLPRADRLRRREARRRARRLPGLDEAERRVEYLYTTREALVAAAGGVRRRPRPTSSSRRSRSSSATRRGESSRRSTTI